MVRLLIGGSPCTYWSIAQKNNRETEARGIGWELFKNYLIAKEKFKPDYFIYENNVSAASPIKQQIRRELCAWDIDSRLLTSGQVQYIEINSALVSAQNRKRFYVHNFSNIGQPDDRGILLKDILESGMDLTQNEKSYALTASYDGAVAWNTIERSQRNMVAEPVIYQNPHGFNEGGVKYGKCPTITSSPSGAYGNMVVESVCIAQRGRYFENDTKTSQCYEIRKDGKTNTLTTVQKDNLVAKPVRIGDIGKGGQGYRIYSTEGKAVAQTSTSGGQGAKTGLYAVPVSTNLKDKSRTITAGYCFKNRRDFEQDFITHGQLGCTGIIDEYQGQKGQIYEVQNGQITIKGKEYPIRLPDGFYIIRKLTVTECRRLQTIPNWYKMPCSATQNYKMLGNGWTVEVIKHLLKSLARQEVEVLSMYDGMSCGRIALEELGCKVSKYYSYEIDKYCIQTTQANFPDTVQMGDAFGIRENSWSYNLLAI